MASFSPMDEYRFKQKLNKALVNVKQVLQAHKTARVASEVHHQYEDKYLLAEFLVNTAVASQLHCFSRLGLKQDQLTELADWASRKAVSLEFRCSEDCHFIREDTKNIESKNKVVTEERAIDSDGHESAKSVTHKVVTTVTEYFWNWTSSYEILVYSGVGTGTERIVLQEGTVSEPVITTNKDPPYAKSIMKEKALLDLTWLLRNLDVAGLTPKFSISRHVAGCATPRRNPEVNSVLNHFRACCEWSRKVIGYFKSCNSNICRSTSHHCLRKDDQVFAPVWPLFRDPDAPMLTPAADDAEIRLDIRDDMAIIPAVASCGTEEASTTNEADLFQALDAGIAFSLSNRVVQALRNTFVNRYGVGAQLNKEAFRSTLLSVVEMGERQLDVVVEDIYKNVPPDGALSVGEVLEYFFPSGDSSAESEGRALLSVADANSLLAEERRLLAERCKRISEQFSDLPGTVASFLVVLVHMAEVAAQLEEGLDFIEGMIRKQLVAAIGKYVSMEDFSQYMRFHNRKLFQEVFEPRPFCYAVRRSALHAPEGTLSIESTYVSEDSMPEQPILTMVNDSDPVHPMYFPLGAAVNVKFRGERFLHASCLQEIPHGDKQRFAVEVRARQFSSFIVLIGRVASATMLDVTYGAIVQNKDELTVPLELSTIPTPKEFRDAIESLSPEQQEFAKAFRAMQLESTLFGVLIIQIKPQLEQLLGLPEDSLTKELQLTQDLMELFIKYQIPSDLISFQGVESSPADVKIEMVKFHVKAMQDVIKQGMQSVLEEAKMTAQMELKNVQEESRRQIEEEKARCRREIEEARRQKQRELEELQEPQSRELSFDYPEERCMMRCAAAEDMAFAEMCGAPMDFLDIVQSVEPALQARERDVEAIEEMEADESNDQHVVVEENLCNDQVVDYTQIPKELDRRFAELDVDGCLRPTIINVVEAWQKKSQPNFLTDPNSTALQADDLRAEKNRAFDLLDALTRSGALMIDHASLHVVLAATHRFDKTIVDTAVEDNINPIEKVERSTLIMATTIHHAPADRLLKSDQVERVKKSSPMLFAAAELQR